MRIRRRDEEWGYFRVGGNTVLIGLLTPPMRQVQSKPEEDSRAALQAHTAQIGKMIKKLNSPSQSLRAIDTISMVIIPGRVQ